jgi:hypothetical protein
MAVEYLRAAGSGHFSWLPQKTIQKNIRQKAWIE